MENRLSVTIENHVADVKLNRPEKMNALDDAMFEALIAMGDKLNADSSVRCVVLSGEGRSFCAGLDLSNFDMNSDITGIPDRTHGIANKWQKAVYTWRELAVPVIAAVHGVSFGGGLQIMLASDIRYIKADTVECYGNEMGTYSRYGWHTINEAYSKR